MLVLAVAALALPAPLKSLGLAPLQGAGYGPPGSRSRRPSPQEFLSTAILTPTTLLPAALSLICPTFCYFIGFSGDDFDPTLVTLAIATPSAFSINAAYARRERAIAGLADFRAAAWCIHESSMRWGTEEQADQVEGALQELFAGLSRMLYISSELPPGSVDVRRQALMRGEPYAQLRMLGNAVEQIRVDPPEGVKADIGALMTALASDERLLARSVEQVARGSTTHPFTLPSLHPPTRAPSHPHTLPPVPASPTHPPTRAPSRAPSRPHTVPPVPHRVPPVFPALRLIFSAPAVADARQVRTVATTRTPVLLRGFTASASIFYPLLFAPYFASMIEATQTIGE